MKILLNLYVTSKSIGIRHLIVVSFFLKYFHLETINKNIYLILEDIFSIFSYSYLFFIKFRLINNYFKNKIFSFDQLARLLIQVRTVWEKPWPRQFCILFTPQILNRIILYLKNWMHNTFELWILNFYIHIMHKQFCIVIKKKTSIVAFTSK